MADIQARGDGVVFNCSTQTLFDMVRPAHRNPHSRLSSWRNGLLSTFDLKFMHAVDCSRFIESLTDITADASTISVTTLGVPKLGIDMPVVTAKHLFGRVSEMLMKNPNAAGGRSIELHHVADIKSALTLFNKASDFSRSIGYRHYKQLEDTAARVVSDE
jgi:hypothetical protein